MGMVPPMFGFVFIGDLVNYYLVNGDSALTNAAWTDVSNMALYGGAGKAVLFAAGMAVPAVKDMFAWVAILSLAHEAYMLSLVSTGNTAQASSSVNTFYGIHGVGLVLSGLTAAACMSGMAEGGEDDYYYGGYGDYGYEDPAAGDDQASTDPYGYGGYGDYY